MKKEKGQSMVEMAVMIPLLFMLLVGIFEVGIVFHNHLVLNQAAREGARCASLGGSDQEVGDKIYEAADALINSFFLKGQLDGPITVSTPQGTNPGNPVTITIPYKIYFALPLMGEATLIEAGVPAAYTMAIQDQ
ncbi:pilus assembly protein [Patescibacteria group bacterium]|nr:pilus assembly protein [Patescibacteria group bacterium]MBU1684573.1 pilus assembly protein [Patescibacteria group bacterium]MBU1987831.1 pilus assembly protein [Patescibacteria group bacterium]